MQEAPDTPVTGRVSRNCRLKLSSRYCKPQHTSSQTKAMHGSILMLGPEQPLSADESLFQHRKMVHRTWLCLPALHVKETNAATPLSKCWHESLHMMCRLLQEDGISSRHRGFASRDSKQACKKSVAESCDIMDTV